MWANQGMIFHWSEDVGNSGDEETGQFRDIV